MATAAQIREAAAYRLSIMGEGLTLASYEAADLDESYVEVYAQLAALNLAVWDFDEDVPDEYTSHVAALVAYNRTTVYPVPDSRYVRLARDSDTAIPAIRELQTNDIIDQDQPDYF